MSKVFSRSIIALGFLALLAGYVSQAWAGTDIFLQFP
jgi:hypothetical protein